MDEDYNNYCEICFVLFDTSHKIPKQLECCKSSFCLSCLKDIYKKNNYQLHCPICRTITNKNPEDLILNKKKLEPELTCPTCSKGTKQSELGIIVTDKNSTIVCSKCSSTYIYENLSDYLLNVGDEMEFYINSFCNFQGDSIENMIELQVDDIVDNLLQPILKNLKTRMKSKIMNEVWKGYQLVSEEKFFSNIFKQFSEFKLKFNSFKEINRTKIKNEDFHLIKTSLDYYINNSEKIRMNGKGIKEFAEHITNNFIVQFNNMLVDYDDVENILEKFFVVNVKDSDVVGALAKKEFYPTGDNFRTGVKFIEKKNANLYKNFLKKNYR